MRAVHELRLDRNGRGQAPLRLRRLDRNLCGGGGIRTHVSRETLTGYEPARIGHSRTPPYNIPEEEEKERAKRDAQVRDEILVAICTLSAIAYGTADPQDTEDTLREALRLMGGGDGD